MPDTEIAAALDDEWFTPAEVAQTFKLTEPSLANMRSKNEGPRFIKLGPHRSSPVRYPRRALIAWIASNNKPAAG